MRIFTEFMRIFTETQDGIKNKLAAPLMLILGIAIIGCLHILLYLLIVPHAETPVASPDIRAYVQRLGQYKDLTTDIKLQHATSEEIDAELTKIAKELNYIESYEDSEYNAQQGDCVTLIFNQISDTETPEAYQTVELGSGTLTKAFEDKLVGLKKDTEQDITVDTETGAHVYHVKILDIAHYKNPDDNMAVMLQNPDLNTLKDLKDYIRSTLNTEYQNTYNAKVRSDLLKQVFNATTFNEIPDEIIQKKANALTVKLQKMADTYSTDDTPVTFNDIVRPTMESEGYTGSVTDFIQYIAKKQLQQEALLKEIFESERLSVDDLEIYSDAALEWAEQKDQYNTLEDFIKDHEFEDYRIARVNAKALDFIIQNARTEYKDTKEQ